MKTARLIFLISGLVFSHIACASIAYHYCDYEWGARLGWGTLSGEAAFLHFIPFGVCSVICFISALAVYLKERRKR